jgi:hypothetical protein
MIRMIRRRLAILTMATVLAALGVFGLAATPALAAGPCTFPTGGDWFAVTCWNSSYPLTSLSEEYGVPPDPSSTGESSFAIWGGLQDAGGDALLQNVLNWNGYSWSAYPEYYWGGNTSHPNNMNWPSISVNPGDTLTSTISATNCDSDGHCTWSETIHDVNTDGNTASDAIGSQNVFVQLLGGVLEVRTGHGCASLPYDGHIAFRDISVTDNQIFDHPGVTFGNSTPDHQCSMVVNSSPTSADFIWKRN